MPLRPALPARQTHDWQRHGVAGVFAVLDVACGHVPGERRPRHTGDDLLAFLQKVARHHRGELHVFLDNWSSHRTPAVQAWLAAHPRVQFHFTPTGASWLDMIEAWFSVLTPNSIRRGSFDTVRALVHHTAQSLKHWNNHTVPFVWAKSAEQLIATDVRR